MTLYRFSDSFPWRRSVSSVYEKLKLLIDNLQGDQLREMK